MIDDMSQNELRQAGDQGPVREHVQTCTICKDYLQKALALAYHLDQWEVPEPQGNTAASVMAQIAQKERDRYLDGSRFWRQCHAALVYRLHVPAAAAILLLIMLAVSLSMNINSWQRPAARSLAQNAQNPTILEPVKVIPVTESVKEPSLSFSQEKGAASSLADSIQSYLIHPESASGALIIILGAPPVFPSKPTDNRPYQQQL